MTNETKEIYELIDEKQRQEIDKKLKKFFLSRSDVVTRYYIDKRIEKNSESHQDELETLNLKAIKRIIDGEDGYVRHVDELEPTVNRNCDYFSYLAERIYIVFMPNNTFYIGFDGEISDNRKVFNTIDHKTISYDELYAENKDLYWVKFSDLCKQNKVFSMDSLNEIKAIVEFLLNSYPEFYNIIFDNKSKGKQIQR
ncbi:MAG: hypothetical protein IJ565_02390 [Bacilli bacterium]|nr:hypothetical protein [Bacilli bacterium]